MLTAGCKISVAVGVTATTAPRSVEVWPSYFDTDGNAAPLGWECHWRNAAYMYGTKLQPGMSPGQRAQLVDALELSGGRARAACPHITPPPRPPPLRPADTARCAAGCFDTHMFAPPVLTHWCQPSNHPNNTVESCARCCNAGVGLAADRARFVGLGGCDGGTCGTQCACLSQLPAAAPVPQAQCAVPCPGNTTQRCGGDWRCELYNTSCLGDTMVARSPRLSAFDLPQPPSLGSHAIKAWFVDPTSGSDRNSGTEDAPFASVAAALAASRKAGGGPRAINLRAGAYFDTALEFGPADSNLTLVSFDGPGLALLTGAVKLTKMWAPMPPGEQLKLFPAASANNLTVLKMPLADTLSPDSVVEGLQFLLPAAGAAVPKIRRATRARFPNVESIETTLYPHGWINSPTKWAGQTFADRSTVIFKNFSRTSDSPLSGDPEFGWRGSYQDYWLGVGGDCGRQFDPPEAPSCAGDEHQIAMSTLGNGLTHIGAPSKGPVALSIAASALPNSKHYNEGWWEGAVVHGRPTDWFTSQWAIKTANVPKASAGGKLSVHLGRGGFGGQAATSSCNGWWLDNVGMELDSVNEFYFNASARTLFYIENATAAVITGNGRMGLASEATATALTRQVLVNITSGVANLTFSGLRFAGAANTFLASHGVPSGGDWTLANVAAIVAEGTEYLAFQSCTFERLDGSAILLRGRHRGARVEGNEFTMLGASAVAAWGRTGRRNPVDGSTIDGWNGTTGEQPRGTLFSNNFVHEIGHFQKQSSAWFQAKSCLNNITGNIMFNGPRAMVNFNDGFGGGSVVSHNLFFNTVRETGDHGPFNMWDRQPFLTEVRNGTPSVIPATNRVISNFMIANYAGAAGPIDTDDGSSYVHAEGNFLSFGGGIKSQWYGHSMNTTNNIYAYPVTVFGAYCIHANWYQGPHIPVSFPIRYWNNTCILPEKQCNKAYSRMEGCSADLNASQLWVKMHDNRVYSDGSPAFGCTGFDGNFTAYTERFDRGTVVLPSPEGEEIIKWARQLLAF